MPGYLPDSEFSAQFVQYSGDDKQTWKSNTDLSE